MPTDTKISKVFRSRRKHVDHMHKRPLHKRWLHKLEGWNKQLTVRLLCAWIHAPKVSGPVDPRGISSVLIIRTDAIGDMVISTAIWRLLKRQFPRLRIGVIGNFRNLPVILHDPDVDARFEVVNWKPQNVLRLLRQVRATKWDIVIPLIYSQKTKMAIFSRLFAPNAISSMVLLRGNSARHYGQLFSIVEQTGTGMDEQAMLDLIKVHIESTLAVSIPYDEWRPSLYPDPEAVLRIQDEVNDIETSDGTSGFVHINLEARTSFRELGIENSFELSRILRSRYPMLSILWTASPASAASVEAFLSTHSEPGIHFQRTNTIDELIALVRQARLVISPDTSVVHIASAERKPVIALLRSHSAWHPYKVPHQVLIPEYGRPVSTIQVGQIVDAFDKLIMDVTLPYHS